MSDRMYYVIYTDWQFNEEVEMMTMDKDEALDYMMRKVSASQLQERGILDVYRDGIPWMTGYSVEEHEIESERG